MSTYNYNIPADTANGAVAPDKLVDEINNSSISAPLDYIGTRGINLDIVFTSALTTGDETTLTAVVAAHDGVPYPETTTPQLVQLSEKKSPTTKRLEVQVMKPEGSSATRVSHDFTDKTTWYQGSIEVTGETMTDSGDGLTFNSANDYWIDLTNGKVYDEYNIADKKEPKIYDNGTEVTSGITINYDTGDVTFASAPTGPVTCDYWYASSSTFTLAPEAGKVMFIEHAELQFTTDVQVVDAINFEIWVYNPADLPNKFPYQVIKYKNFRDIINAANLGTGKIPVLDGFTKEICVFPFNYVTVKPFASSVGAELRITVDNHSTLVGEWGTATFYISSEDEES